MNKMNTTYQDIITSFVLNKMLHHVVILLIIETHKQLKYYTDKHNSDWITGGLWYNIFIKKTRGNVFESFIRNARTDRYKIMCSIDAREKSIRQNMMTEAAVVVIQCHKIQQQKHYFFSVKP